MVTMGGQPARIGECEQGDGRQATEHVTFTCEGEPQEVDLCTPCADSFEASRHGEPQYLHFAREVINAAEAWPLDGGWDGLEARS